MEKKELSCARRRGKNPRSSIKLEKQGYCKRTLSVRTEAENKKGKKNPGEKKGSLDLCSS